MVRTTGIGEARYPVQAVAARTGLSPPLLRAWERRYGAIEPERNPAGERLYTDRQIHRLNLLRMLTHNGHRISQIARLPEAELERLLLDAGIRPFESPVQAENSDLEHVLFGRGLAAVNALDAEMLEAEIARARTVLTPLGLVDGVLCPLIRRAESMPARGPVVRAASHGLVELMTEAARDLAREVAPLGSGRAMLVWNMGMPRDASLSMAAATTSLQGLRAGILHEEASTRDIRAYVTHEHAVGVVASLPCHTSPDSARTAVEDLCEALEGCHSTTVLCVAPRPEIFAAVESIGGIEVCATFRELATLIDASRQ